MIYVVWAKYWLVTLYKMPCAYLLTYIYVCTGADVEFLSITYVEFWLWVWLGGHTAGWRHAKSRLKFSFWCDFQRRPGAWFAVSWRRQIPALFPSPCTANRQEAISGGHSDNQPIHLSVSSHSHLSIVTHWLYHVHGYQSSQQNVSKQFISVGSNA